MSLRILCSFLFAILQNASLAGEGEFHYLKTDKQNPQLLTWFLKHIPSEDWKETEPALTFNPILDGITAHLSPLDHTLRWPLFSIRYLSDKRLEQGNTGAVHMLIVAPTQEDQTRFVPLIVPDRKGDVENYSVSVLQKFGTTPLFWLRKEYSGNARLVTRMALTSGEAGSRFKLYDPFPEINPLKDLERQGWEPWHRGNYFEEDTLTLYYHLYRKPGEKASSDEYPHRWVRVRCTFKGGKIVPGKLEENPDGQ